MLGDCCARCGFNDRRALQVDHIRGGGAQRVKALGAWGAIDEVLNHSDPVAEFQILCANCNWIKRAERDENRGYDAGPHSEPAMPLFDGLAS